MCQKHSPCYKSSNGRTSLVNRQFCTNKRTVTCFRALLYINKLLFQRISSSSSIPLSIKQSLIIDLVTGFGKSCDGCHFYLGFSSLPPLWVLGSSSMGPLFLLEIRGRIEVATRLQRGSDEKLRWNLFPEMALTFPDNF